MDIRQLEIFKCLADRQSFSQAAQELHLSQPTVSAHLQALEQELRRQLIHRTTRAFYLTEDGRKLYRYAQQMLALRQRALADLSREHPRELSVGTSSVPGVSFVPQMISGFLRTQPDTRLYVTHSDSMDILEKLAFGELDVGFVGTKSDNGCVLIPLTADRLVIVAPNNSRYRAMQAQAAPLEAWLKEPFLLRSEQSGTQKEWARALDTMLPHRTPLRVVASIDDAEVLRLCVAQGLGISILSRQVARPMAQAGKVLLVDLEGEVWNRTLYLAHRAEPYLSVIAQDFVRFAGSLAHSGEIAVNP